MRNPDRPLDDLVRGDASKKPVVDLRLPRHVKTITGRPAFLVAERDDFQAYYGTVAAMPIVRADPLLAAQFCFVAK
jgi:hypothetical protein